MKEILSKIATNKVARIIFCVVVAVPVWLIFSAVNNDTGELVEATVVEVSETVQDVTIITDDETTTPTITTTTEVVVTTEATTEATTEKITEEETTKETESTTSTTVETTIETTQDAE